MKRYEESFRLQKVSDNREKTYGYKRLISICIYIICLLRSHISSSSDGSTSISVFVYNMHTTIVCYYALDKYLFKLYSKNNDPKGR